MTAVFGALSGMNVVANEDVWVDTMRSEDTGARLVLASR